MILVDTSVLVSFVDDKRQTHLAVNRELKRLFEHYAMTIAPQCLYELYVVATRPPTVNGLGQSPGVAVQSLRRLTGIFTVMPEPEGMRQYWMQLVEHHSVSGKTAHDARLVAFMQGHGIAQLFTLNPRDFQRYVPAITLVGLDLE